MVSIFFLLKKKKEKKNNCSQHVKFIAQEINEAGCLYFRLATLILMNFLV